nr:hypothetical protein [uncultured Eubacterium sp.]
MTRDVLTEKQKLFLDSLLRSTIDNFREESERLLSVDDFSGSEDYLTAIDEINEIFESITQDEFPLATWFSDGMVNCGLCPAQKVCNKFGDITVYNNCSRLLREWMKTEDGQEPEPDVFPW